MTLQPHKKHLTIISGLAGSGKTVAIHALEDLGYYCVDNLPASLLLPFADALAQDSIKADFIGLALDARDPDMPEVLKSHFTRFSELCHIEILFIEAREDVVLKRYRETRRLHPLSRGQGTGQPGQEFPKSLHEAIQLDIQTLAPIRLLATRLVDTSEMSAQFLRQFIRHEYSPTAASSDIQVNIVSFGFKHGIPQDVDTLFDVRCFPNPHYVAELRPLTGLSKEVREFVFTDPNVAEFIARVENLLIFMYPLYRTEGKRYYGVGIGCTGGKHRSVAIVEELSIRLKKRIPSITVEHRHFDKE